jgi:hypothetical protein
LIYPPRSFPPLERYPLHTYYVEAGDTPVLVHNSNCPRFVVDSNGVATDLRASGSWRDSFNALADGKQAGRVKVVDNSADLRSLFDEWVTGGTRLPARGPKIPDVYQLEDGSTIQWRLASRSGGETVDIRTPDGQQLKVHLDGEG